MQLLMKSHGSFTYAGYEKYLYTVIFFILFIGENFALLIVYQLIEIKSTVLSTNKRIR